MNFIKRVLSTVVGIAVFLGLCLFFLVLIGMAFGDGDKDKVTVKDNSVLNLKLDKPIKDYAGQFDYGELNELLGKNKKHNGLFDVIHAIEYATTDDKIQGIKSLKRII